MIGTKWENDVKEDEVDGADVPSEILLQWCRNVVCILDAGRVTSCLEDTRMRADRGLSAFGRTKTQLKATAEAVRKPNQRVGHG